MTARASLGVDKVLSNFAILNRNPDDVFIADKVLPPIGVSGRVGKLYTVANGFRFSSPLHTLKRGSGAAFRRFTLDVRNTSVYSLEEYGAEFPVDDVDAEFAKDDEVMLREAATTMAVQQLQIEREREAEALLTNSSVITQGATLSSGSRWDDSGIDPRATIETGAQTIQKATGIPRRLLSLVTGQEAIDKLMRNDALLQFFRTSIPGITMLTEAQIAQALGIKEVIAGGAVANSANEGQSASNAYIWGKDATLCFIEKNPQPMAPRGTGFTFYHRSRGPVQVERYREEPRSEIVLASSLEDRVLTAAASAYLIQTAVN